jgi:hypothetical protein
VGDHQVGRPGVGQHVCAQEPTSHICCYRRVLWDTSRKLDFEAVNTHNHHVHNTSAQRCTTGAAMHPHKCTSKTRLHLSVWAQ